MRMDIAPGKYIVAVSGGVDSVALLHILAARPELELVVAHFNHGIRDAAGGDELFVESLAVKLNLKFETGNGQLGAAASEDEARRARYEFLNRMRDKHEATSIVTAHHQDDLIETALINIMRGTGPRGLVAIMNNPEITRPLINTPKKDILDFAKKNKIVWIEDDSNQDERYLRNKLRHVLANKLTSDERLEVLNYIKELAGIEGEKDELLDVLGHHVFENEKTISRSSFIFLPSDVANELILHWLRLNHVTADRRLINRLSVAIKTGRANSIHSINKDYSLRLSAQKALLMGNSQDSLI